MCIPNRSRSTPPLPAREGCRARQSRLGGDRHLLGSAWHERQPLLALEPSGLLGAPVHLETSEALLPDTPSFTSKARSADMSGGRIAGAFPETRSSARLTFERHWCWSHASLPLET